MTKMLHHRTPVTKTAAGHHKSRFARALDLFHLAPLGYVVEFIEIKRVITRLCLSGEFWSVLLAVASIHPRREDRSWRIKKNRNMQLVHTTQLAKAIQEILSAADSKSGEQHSSIFRKSFSSNFRKLRVGISIIRTHSTTVS